LSLIILSRSIAYTKGIFSITDVHNDLIEISGAFSPGKILNLEGIPQYIDPSDMPSFHYVSVFHVQWSFQKVQLRRSLEGP
jgi:hypothetical protein